MVSLFHKYEQKKLEKVKYLNFHGICAVVFIHCVHRNDNGCHEGMGSLCRTAKLINVIFGCF